MARVRNWRLDPRVRSGADRLGNLHDLVDSDVTKRGIGNLRWNPEDCQGEEVNQPVNAWVAGYLHLWATVAAPGSGLFRPATKLTGSQSRFTW